MKFINYSKITQNKNAENTVNETTVKEVVDTEQKVVEEVVTVSGVVINCERLNVREKATKESKVLCIINVSSGVVVTINESTEDFYKVCTPSGINGYCMKKFIKII